MRVLLVTNYFPPEIGAAAELYHELAETLIDHGHRVTVVTGFPRYRMGDRRERGLLRRDRLGHVEVLRVLSSSLDQGGPLRRGLDHLYLAPSLFLGGMTVERPDVVLAYSPPLTLGATAWCLARRWRIPFVVNVQDLFPKYAVDIGLMTNPLMIRGFEALERFIYRTADAITVNSPGSRPHVMVRGGKADRVSVASNWVDVDFIRPGPTDNAFRRECGLGDRFVVQYAGTMGYQQDLDSVLEAARILRHESGIMFQFVGDGVERERLETKAHELRLDNVAFTPYRPRTRIPEVIGAADAGVVTLRKDVRTPAIPSKLLTIMAAGKPVIVSADPAGDAPQIVTAVGSGVCTPAGEPDRFAEAVLTLRGDPNMAAQMGERGRRYAEAECSREGCVSRYEHLFEDVICRYRHR